MKKIITSAIALFVGFSMQAQQEESVNTLPEQRTEQTTEVRQSPHLGRGGNLRINMPARSEIREMKKGDIRRAMQRHEAPARLEEQTRRR